MNALLNDLRYGLRMLRKNPGFSAVAIITLALGIGANTAIFSLTYAVILKSLPVPNPQELVRYTFREPGVTDLSLSGPVYDALRRHETVNRDILAWSNTDLALQENGAVTRVSGAMMTGNGFRVLELRPYLGRLFGEADDVSGGGPNGYQALLGYDYWKQHFGANAGVVGRSLNINGRTVTIIGVLPAGFDGLIAGQRADIVLPLAFEGDNWRRDPGNNWLTLMGRLKPGKTLQSAVANLKATNAVVLEEADPSHRFLGGRQGAGLPGGFFGGFEIGVESGRGGRSYLKVAYSRPLVALELLVGLLLLLCCANTALLMLARVSSRFREFAVRNALGAPRGRLFQQVLSEVGLLAACGLAGGVWLGWAAARSLVDMLAWVGEPPPSLDVTPRIAILAFAAGTTVLSALAAGLWPALRASGVDPALDLKRGEALSSSKRLGNWMVPAQVAVSVTLLAAASLLGSTFVNLLVKNSGFEPSGVVMADVDLSAAKPNPKQAGRDVGQILEAVENAPGVQAATVAGLPIDGGWAAGHYFSLGNHGSVHTDMRTWPESVTPGYFATMGTRILEGRGFARADQKSSRVCVLSASAAAYFFPGEDALGKYVYSGGGDPRKDGHDLDPRDAYRVVGIAEDAHFLSLREAAPRMLYSLAASDDWGDHASLAVRSSSTTLGASAIRDAVHRVVPGAAEPTIFTFNELVRTHLQAERMLMALSVSFAGVGLLLTALGLYGVLARSVVLRTREIGLRLALGANPRHALRMVVTQGLRLTWVGVALGLALALAVTRSLRSLLFGIQPNDPWMLAGVVVALLAVAFAASYIPARRATKVDPMAALRYE
jgi:predicted permease